MRCSRCGHIDNRPKIFYCPRCSTSLGRGIGLLPAYTSQATQLAAQPSRQGAALARPGEFDTRSYPAAIQSIYQARYQAEELLNEGNPLWGLIKHFKALQAWLEANKYISIQGELQKQAYTRFQQQAIDGQLAQRAAEQQDAILREQLQRKSMMLAEAIKNITALVDDSSMAELPDELKADIINMLYQQAEAWIFRIDTPSPPVTPSRPYNGTVIINADEF